MERLGADRGELESLRNAAKNSGATGYWTTRLHATLKRPQPASFNAAEIYARLADPRRAVDHLERAFEERHTWLVYLNCDPAFDGIRGDPAFRAMVRKVGLPVERGSNPRN